MRTVAHTLVRAGLTLLGLWFGGAESALAADAPASAPVPYVAEQPLPVPSGWTVRLMPYLGALA